MLVFSVTYEVITPESAEHGDAEESGFIAENCDFKTAVSHLGYGDGGIEANEYPVTDPGWITAYQVDHDYSTGGIENRSLHFPHTMTPASKSRVCRLLGVYGVA